jgi:glycosyltransferase involved in cell wall biosynthesis
MTTLSVVMPAYNEATNIERCVREWYENVIARIPGSELVVVDDCSRDDTGARLRTLAASLPGLQPLSTPSNSGHGPAVRFGLDNCSGEFIFHTDSDRQHTPDDFWRLWDRRHDADFLLGVRQQRADGAFRTAVSLLLRLSNFLIWGCWIKDANCPFKLLRRSALERIIIHIPRDCFIPMVMVSVFARRFRFRVEEVPVRHFARTGGEQSLRGFTKWVKVGARCAGQLLELRLSMLLTRPQAGTANLVNSDPVIRADTRDDR